MAGRVGLLGALATAGITSLAYDHVRSLSKPSSTTKIQTVASQFATPDPEAGEHPGNRELANQLDVSIEKTRNYVPHLFSHFIGSREPGTRARLKAREQLLNRSRDQMGVLLRIEGPHVQY